MSQFLRVSMLAALVISIGGLACSAPVSAQVQPASVAQSTSGLVTGTVTDSLGNPVVSAEITLRGRATVTAITDKAGKFSVRAMPGIYSAIVRKTGFLVANDDEVLITPDGAKVDIQLTQSTFSSLQTIGRVSARGAANKFNVTPASVDVATRQTFLDHGDLQIRNVLNQTPGIISGLPGSVNTASAGAITFPNIRGALAFETASLVDGHPLSVGSFGDYVTTFLNPYVLQSVETIKGPGSISPQISRSIGGTVNFRTIDPTSSVSGNLTLGTDSNNGIFSNFGYSNTVLNGKLGFVVDYAINGTPGVGGSPNFQYTPAIGVFTYTDSQGNLVKLPPNPKQPTVAGQANQNSSALLPVVAYGYTAPFIYTNKTELVKLRYNFSAATSLTASYLGSQTWSDQNGNNGDYIPTTFAPGAAYAGSFPSGPNRLHKTPFSYGDEWEINNEPIVSAELRTGYKNDNITARYYHASIYRLQYNGATNPSANSPIFPVQLFGTDANGKALNGNDSFGQPYRAQETDGGYYFSSGEEDKLYGYSFEYDHVFGPRANVLTFTTDQNYSATYSYNQFNPEVFNTVPKGSTQNTATYLLRGQFNVSDNLSATAGLYLTNFVSHFGSAVYQADPTLTPTLGFFDQRITHDDARLGLQYRLNPNASLRLSAGSAIAPPYLATLATSQRPAALCTNKSPYTCPAGFGIGQAAVSNTSGLNVLPETSFGYDLGGDFRPTSDRNTVIKADVYRTNLFNQFVRTTFPNGTFPTGGTTVPLYTNGYSNLSRARYEGLELGITRQPDVGFGYVLQGALLRGYAQNVPPGGYPGKPGIVGGINFSDQSVSNQSIPYSQGYGEINFHTVGGGYLSLGGTYYGPNNGFGIAPAIVFGSSLRFPIGNRSTTLQISGDNIFNRYPSIFPTLFSGVPVPYADGRTYATAQKNFGPSIFRVSLSHNFGKK